MRAPSGEVQVQLCPDGPALLRGATIVRDADGVEHPVTRPVVALCTCGLTQRPPWCDATHKVTQRAPARAPGKAAARRR